MYSIWFLLLAGTAAHSTLIVDHFQRMWLGEQYQFFPIALIAAGVLVYLRRDLVLSNATTPNRAIATTALAMVAISTFVVSALRYGPIGWLNFLAFCMVIVYCSYGWGGFKQFIPILIFLLAIKPLPEVLEQPFTILLQQVASTLASYMLDSIDILHYKQGVVLVLAEQSFLAEDACSGIRSLFSSIVAVIFIGIVYHYHWFRNTINVLQTILWVIVFNAFRIAVVIFVEEKTDFSIASGLPHEIAGVVAFLMIFGTVLSTDALFNAIVPAKVFDDEEEEEVNEEQAVSAATPALDSNLVSEVNWGRILHWNWSSKSAIAWTTVFALMAVFAVRVSFVTKPGEVEVASLPAPEREHLPSELGGWQVQDFQHISRDEHNIEGANSYVWKLSKGPRSVLISVDGTFTDYHDLWLCYSAIGWTADKRQFYTPLDDRIAGKKSNAEEYSTLECSKKTGEKGFVYFSAIDKRGVDVYPVFTRTNDIALYLRDRFMKSIRYALMLPEIHSERLLLFTPPVSTIQAVYTPSSAIKEDDLAEVKQLFLVARELLRKSPRFQDGT